VITYTLNRTSGVLHQRVDGRSYESCNLDQIKRRADFDELPLEIDMQAEDERYYRCKRCFRERAQ
jgi:hypothetical protein